ncbi:MAG: DUF1804 family protein [Methylovulum miyakonense]|uniref:DUF1804 family protein n=1 Tax=Methylovulum miyakonense TaxID=645578 RepID=UPI003BB7106B
MAHSPDIVQAVRGSYVFERLPLPVAAAKHNVSYSSAQAWKKKALEAGDDWERARSASLMAAGGLGDITNQIIESFTLLFQTTIQDIQDGEYTPLEKAEVISRLSDSYAKMMKAAGGANPKISKLAIAMEVLSEQAAFIKANYPEDIERFAKILDPFGARICEVFG